MFAEWVLIGCSIAIKAFVAVLVFFLLVLAVAGLLGTLIAIAKGGDDDDLDRR